MAEQIALTWGGITLCDPSNGKDGYRLVDDDVTKADVYEVSVPGTAGRIMIVKGTGQSEQTSTHLTFECESLFESAAAYYDFRDAIEAKVTDPDDRLDVVSYGILNMAGGNSVNDCDMQYRLKDFWVDAAGKLRVQFTATFTKWSG